MKMLHKIKIKILIPIDQRQYIIHAGVWIIYMSQVNVEAKENTTSIWVLIYYQLLEQFINRPTWVARLFTVTWHPAIYSQISGNMN
jgi:hypothetical protein